jgi:hypothetical protein
MFLRDIFKHNGYNDRQIHSALNCCLHLDQPDSKSNSVTFLPFVRTIFNSISRVMARYNIKSVGLSRMKLSSLLRPVKDRLGLRTPGIYRIAEHSNEHGHSIQFHNSSILVTKTRYVDCC